MLVVFFAGLVLSGLYKAFSWTTTSTATSPSSRSVFGTHEVVDLQKRMQVVEADIARLARTTELDHQTLATLHEILPDYVIAHKDKYGNIIIAEDFWAALLDKVRYEESFFEKETKGSWLSDSKSGISLKTMQGVARKTWDDYMKANQDKIFAWDTKKLDQAGKHLYQEGLLYQDKHIKATKDELIERIKKNWDDTRYEIQSQLGPISKKLEDSLYQLSKLEHKAVSKEMASNIAHDVLSKLVPNAKLTAQASANLKRSTDIALTRVNHFSVNSGAVINPVMTSPNYLFPAMRASHLRRFTHWAMGLPVPRPNHASIALQKWDEYGECWCSPTRESGKGVTLAIIAGNFIQPHNVIVEHIPEIGTLEPGAAPRDMELLANIEDPAVFAAIRSDPYYKSAIVKDDLDFAGWIRLSSWVYDASSDQSIQTFGVLDLRAFGETVAAQQYVVRAKSNWNPETVPYTCMYRVRLTGDVIIKA